MNSEREYVLKSQIVAICIHVSGTDDDIEWLDEFINDSTNAGWCLYLQEVKHDA